jgi:type I restriction enzyme M protein
LIGAVADIKPAIFGHTEFTARLFAKWKAANTPRLRGIAQGGKPKALVETLSEDLLDTFEKARLLDPYDVYQHLMDYWAETMQDDVCMIVSDGWREAAKPRLIIEDKDKLTKASVAARLNSIKGDADAANERKVLDDYLALIKKEAATSAKANDAQAALLARVAAQYGKLTEDEIKTLVVDDKWLATIVAAVQGELDRVSQKLTGRVRQLAERYTTPLPQLTDEVEKLAARVNGHLRRMGAVWK